MTISKPVSDKTLIQAISLRLSSCFAALSIANAFGGSRSDDWEIARSHTLADLVADALDRGIDVVSIRSAVDDTPFMDTKSYLRIRDEIGGRIDFPK